MTMSPANDQFYIPFGKELAANEKKNRDKAVRSLKRYLTAGGGSLSEADLYKLWKGLFYCFWMSDKPLVQQALANDLGALILDVPEDNVIPFISTFWAVHCAEWHGLDRIRLDKYLLLFRRVIFYSFSWLAENHWEHKKVEAYTACLLDGPLHPTDRTKPDAIVYHIMEVYFEELEKVMEIQQESASDENDDDLSAPMNLLMEPIVTLSTDALNKTTRIKAKQILREYEEFGDEEVEDMTDRDIEAMDEGEESA
ncbi:putative ribosomal RNA-processing protein [Absidia repens]|uniref:Putative ribosomal RNA-processing protein n=1 Tax=Absidia repens TaxID=90262 RepID=A0A1X2ISQ6_9FUNG|nr:putative ribosomal RNA-processing protein [Absidia repens]